MVIKIAKMHISSVKLWIRRIKQFRDNDNTNRRCDGQLVINEGVREEVII